MFRSILSISFSVLVIFVLSIMDASAHLGRCQRRRCAHSSHHSNSGRHKSRRHFCSNKHRSRHHSHEADNEDESGDVASNSPAVPVQPPAAAPVPVEQPKVEPPKVEQSVAIAQPVVTTPVVTQPVVTIPVVQAPQHPVENAPLAYAASAGSQPDVTAVQNSVKLSASESAPPTASAGSAL